MSNLNSNTSNPINSTKLNSDTIQFDLSDSDVSDDVNFNHDFKKNVYYIYINAAITMF